MENRKPKKGNLTEDEFLRSAENAKATKEDYDKLLRASSVRFSPSTKLLAVTLRNTGQIHFPIGLIPGLRDAPISQLSKVRLTSFGDAVVWDDLNISYTLASLLSGIVDTKIWMKDYGRRGGRARSQSKSEAARRNGKLGGRPRKKEAKTLNK
jgi:hypothetical protein